MIATWACPSKTFVQLVEGAIVKVVPADASSPDWLRVAPLVADGTLMIADFVSPTAATAAPATS